MIGRVISDDVRHRYARTLGIVKVSETVGETRPTMKQRGRRLSRETRIAVRCPSRDALEESKHSGYGRDPVESSDEMHRAGARIGKTSIDSTAD